jgi:K+-transporting ATPase KdpF subunit
MDFGLVAGFALSILLFAYLAFALARPEKF